MSSPFMNAAVVGSMRLRWIAVATRCGPLLSQVVNSTEKHTGAVVSVSCPDALTWDSYQLTNTITAECDHHGNWRPSIPACVRK